jgi:hypothetical protein
VVATLDVVARKACVANHRRDHPHEFAGLREHRVVRFRQVAGLSEDFQSEFRFLQLTKNDLSLFELIARARAVVRLFVVGAGRRTTLEQLIRKCLGDGSLSVQELNDPNDEACEQKQPFAQIVWFLADGPICRPSC